MGRGVFITAVVSAVVFWESLCYAEHYIYQGGQMVELGIDSTKCLILPHLWYSGPKPEICFEY